MRMAVLIIAILFTSCVADTQSNNNSTGPGTGPAGVAVNSIIAANERAAISNLRAIHSSQNAFQSTTGNGSYGSLKQLGESGVLPPNLAQGVSGSYRFEIITANNQTFEAMASPIEYGRTGRRSFFVNESGIVRGADKNGAAANVNDPPVE